MAKERDAEEDVGAALVQLARQLAVRNIKLEQRVARRQLHLRHVGHVPGRHDHAARVRIVPDLVHDLRDLVDVLAGRRRPAAPLVAVDGAEVAVRVRPLVPDRDAVFLQVRDIRGAGEEPDQFMDDRPQVQLFRGHQREPVLQVEAHLVAEHGTGAGAGAVGLDRAMVQHMAHQVVVLAHRCGSI